ncbi:MAG: hypothetical protein IKY27_00140 [Bacteroidales bacterium]|nr:hypothetical protein [Bacteroidales bacterium]
MERLEKDGQLYEIVDAGARKMIKEQDMLMNDLIVPFHVIYDLNQTIPANTTKEINLPLEQVRAAVPDGYKILSNIPVNYMTRNGYTCCCRSYIYNNNIVCHVYNLDTSQVQLQGITLYFLAIRNFG